MLAYKIKDLERFSGIRSHTIRIWEQRFDLLNPKRTKGNSRLYNEEDLKKLLNISTLLESGLKISQVASLSTTERITKTKLIIEYGEKNHKERALVNQLLEFGLSYDQLEFTKKLNSIILKFGMTEAYYNVIRPFVDKIYFLWSSSELATPNRSFILNLLRKTLWVSIDSLELRRNSKDNVILFSPFTGTEDPEMLFANYFLQKNGARVYYLGSMVPALSAMQVVDQTNASRVILFERENHCEEEVQNILNEFHNYSKDLKVSIFCSASLADKLKFPQNHEHVNDIKQLLKKLF